MDAPTMRVRSQFAAVVCCNHCSTLVPPKHWPMFGDSVAFYFENEPGAFSIALDCADCMKRSFVNWDEDPGPMRPLSDDGIPASLYDSPPTQFLTICKPMLREHLAKNPNDTLEDVIEVARGSVDDPDWKDQIERAIAMLWRTPNS